MARSTRGLRLVRVRGARGTWKTYTKDPDPVRDVRRWDAVTLAAIDGGGALRRTGWEPGWAPDPDAGQDSDERPRRRRTRTRSGRAGGQR